LRESKKINWRVKLKNKTSTKEKKPKE